MVLKILLLFICFISTSVISAELEIEQCISNGKMKYILNKKEIIIYENFCFNNDRNILISKNCYHNQACIALKFRNIANQNLFNKGIGTPGFNLCYQLNGIPQILDFNDGKNWFHLDRCQFKQDGSFIDTGSLINIWSNPK
jgi:hypothetical protein